jgi:prephenate dehydrogenase
MGEDVYFGTVAIVGVGLLGGSIGKALLRSHRASHVIGIGRVQERLIQASNLGAVSEFTTNFNDIASRCDIVVICTPVSQIVNCLPNILQAVGDKCTVTDVGSIKSAICAAANGDSRFVGGHPMAGSEQTGVVASRPDLFQEATWALTPGEHASVEHFHKIRALAQQLGAATLVLSPEQHDRAVAVTSHLPHAVATSLMRLACTRAEQAPEIQKLTAGSFADATRVAASSAELWTDIFELNKDALIDVISAYREELDGFLTELKAADRKKLHDRFASGSDAKRSWSSQT